MKDDPKNSTPPTKPVPLEPYSAHDPIPVPEAVESNSDTVWGLWEAEDAKEAKPVDTGFAPTVPSELLPLPSAKPPKGKP